jgi:hypothetical protein
LQRKEIKAKVGSLAGHTQNLIELMQAKGFKAGSLETYAEKMDRKQLN